MTWLPVTLLCALSLAASDAATKAWLQGYSARELALVRFSVAGLLLSPVLLWHPIGWPEPGFWPWMLLLVPLEVLAMLLYMKAIRDHPLSLTLPYLAFTPVFVMLTGWLLLGETVNLPGFAGVLLVVAGGWLLNVGHAELRDWRTWAGPLRAIMREPGSRLMLAVAGIYGLTSAGGKAAMRYTGPESFGAFYFAVIGIATLALFSLNDPQIFRRIWRRPGAVLAVGALTAVMVVSHFIALSLVEVAYMISVKRTSLLFGILFGAVFFRESGLGGHLAAGALMVAGVCLIVAF